MFFAYNIFSQPRGQVITFDQNGNITPVDGANVRICGTDITSNTDQSGEYTFSEQLNIYIDKYILKVTKQNLVSTYTIISPTGLVEDFGKLNLIMMLPSVYSPQQGKSNLIVVTYQYNESENSFTPFFGAEARVYNSNNQRVDNSNNRKYINLSQWDQNGKPLKIELVNEPGDNTVGYVLLNIDPGYYSVSAYKSGYNFIHRPAIAFPNSSTSGICEIDGIWIAEGTTNFEGVLRDEKDRPVENATCRTVGPDFYANTNANGIFLLENLPSPSLLTLKFSKSGYKDAYYIRSIEEGENEFTIITTETFNQILQDLEIEVGQNKGHFVGVVLDYYGNPVKNIIVKVIDENGNEVGGIGVYYMDSNGSKFDKNLTKTTDKRYISYPKP
ncbi:MAG: carboxypeptidase-like regulatory domain-containing protein [Candidatus Aenigmatarchaeota archaeon]